MNHSTGEWEYDDLEDIWAPQQSVDRDLELIEERNAKIGPAAFERSPSPARLLTLRAMPYGEYLRTPEWRAKRAWMLVIENFTCERCEHRLPDREMHVHHRSYDRLGCEKVSDLLLLCADCHAEEHGK